MEVYCLFGLICWAWWREQAQWQTLLSQTTKSTTKIFKMSFCPSSSLSEPTGGVLRSHARAGTCPGCCDSVVGLSRWTRSLCQELRILRWAVANTRPLPVTPAERTSVPAGCQALPLSPLGRGADTPTCEGFIRPPDHAQKQQLFILLTLVFPI